MKKEIPLLLLVFFLLFLVLNVCGFSFKILILVVFLMCLIIASMTLLFKSSFRGILFILALVNIHILITLIST
jgi:hypothetical protein